MEHRTNAKIAMRTSLFDRESAIEKMKDLAFINDVKLTIDREDGRWESKFKIDINASDPVNFALFMRDIDYAQVASKSFMKF